MEFIITIQEPEIQLITVASQGEQGVQGVPGTTVHNDTTGKQGGGAGEFYHLTAAENAAVGGANAPAVINPFETRNNLENNIDATFGGVIDLDVSKFNIFNIIIGVEDITINPINTPAGLNSRSVIVYLAFTGAVIPAVTWPALGTFENPQSPPDISSTPPLIGVEIVEMLYVVGNWWAGVGEKLGAEISVAVECAISQSGVTDQTSIDNYFGIIRGLIITGVWDFLENAYLLGTKHQSFPANAASMVCGGDIAVGTGTHSDYFTTFNGTSDKYLTPNKNQSTAKTGLTFMAVYKYGEVKQPSTLISNYQGGAAKGPALTVGGSTVGDLGPTTFDDVYGFGSVDGSAITVNLDRQDGSDGEWSVAGTTVFDGGMSLIANNRDILSAPLATVWANNTNYGIGSTPHGVFFYGGDMSFVAIFNGGMSDSLLRTVSQIVMEVLGGVLPIPNAVLFEGNSLTATASGGGTNYPNQLLLKAGWSSLTRFGNIATAGAKQVETVEPRYPVSAKQWKPYAPTNDNLFILWSGINDITAGTLSTPIIESLERELKEAVFDGFRVVVLTLTPVSNNGSGLANQYSVAQQTTKDEVNTWITGTAPSLGVQVVDLNEITNTFPLFGDPTDFTYYVTGDGLHQNDAGRGLIADFMDSEVAPPI